MFLQCAECTTRFIVQDNKIGLGRRVRCGVCKHEWYQEANYNNELEIDYNFADIPSEVTPIPVGGNVPVVVNHQGIFWDKVHEIFKSFSLIYLLFLVLIAFFLSQDWLVKNFSAAQKFYNVFGLYDSTGLTFRSVSSKQTEIVGVSNLSVKGYIENSSNKKKRVPNISLKAYNKDGKLIADKLIQGDNSIIPAHQNLFFSQSLEQLSDKVERIQIDMGNSMELIVR